MRMDFAGLVRRTTDVPRTTTLAGTWVYGVMGPLDGPPATNRKEPDRAEASGSGLTPVARLARLAPARRISRARAVDAGRPITAGGITSGWRLAFHLLRRAGYGGEFISEVARVMEYSAAIELYRDNREVVPTST